MRKMLQAAVALALVAGLASTAVAMNKTHSLIQAPDGMDRTYAPWAATVYCTLTYYNYWGGWIYVWSGWSPSDVIGLEYDLADCPPASDECTAIAGMWMYLLDAYPSYGFTAAVHLYRAGDQAGHLGAPIYWGEPQEWYDVWNLVIFLELYHAVILALHFENPGTLAVTTEATADMCLPPSGDPPCLSCPQPAYSYYYGSAATGNFSGSTFLSANPNDLLFDAIIACVGPTAVEPSTWGGVKTMYK
jgi:hypothetical protein